MLPLENAILSKLNQPTLSANTVSMYWKILMFYPLSVKVKIIA